MTVKDTAEKVITQAASFFEKTTELRFFLHVFCVFAYTEIVLYFITNHAILGIPREALEGISPGTLSLSVLGYFALMGYCFRLLYFVVFMAVSALAAVSLFSTKKTQWYEVPGLVSRRDILAKAYASKDYEPVRMLEEHSKRCSEDRMKTKKLAYLYFSALCLGVWSYYRIPGGFLAAGYGQLSSMMGETVANFAFLALFLPLFFIWLDASDDYDRDQYIHHGPLYSEIYAERQQKKEKRGY